MDGQEYLDQISVSAPQKSGGKFGDLLHSKFFIVGAIGVVGLILILILGALLGGGKTDSKTSVTSLALHLSGTAEVVKEYQGSVKSSTLRSSSASLYGVLTNTSRAIGEDAAKNASKAAQKKADEDKEKLKNELFEAKINGLLDRTMARKMAYEISVLMSEEASLKKTTKNEALKQALDESYGSLENLYESFNGFSGGV